MFHAVCVAVASLSIIAAEPIKRTGVENFLDMLGESPLYVQGAIRGFNVIHSTQEVREALEGRNELTIFCPDPPRVNTRSYSAINQQEQEEFFSMQTMLHKLVPKGCLGRMFSKRPKGMTAPVTENMHLYRFLRTNFTDEEGQGSAYKQLFKEAVAHMIEVQGNTQNLLNVQFQKVIVICEELQITSPSSFSDFMEMLYGSEKSSENLGGNDSWALRIAEGENSCQPGTSYKKLSPSEATNYTYAKIKEDINSLSKCGEKKELSDSELFSLAFCIMHIEGFHTQNEIFKHQIKGTGMAASQRIAEIPCRELLKVKAESVAVLYDVAPLVEMINANISDGTNLVDPKRIAHFYWKYGSAAIQAIAEGNLEGFEEEDHDYAKKLNKKFSQMESLGSVCHFQDEPHDIDDKVAVLIEATLLAMGKITHLEIVSAAATSAKASTSFPFVYDLYFNEFKEDGTFSTQGLYAVSILSHQDMHFSYMPNHEAIFTNTKGDMIPPTFRSIHDKIESFNARRDDSEIIATEFKSRAFDNFLMTSPMDTGGLKVDSSLKKERVKLVEME